MNGDTAMAVLEGEKVENPSILMRRATDVAGAAREIVMKTALDLKGRKYVRVEGWQSIAALYGCIPSIREVVEEERGIRAVAELRKHDGTVLATAEGYCGLDEPTWASRAMYARRGMAQTRAVSRVCRSAFAFVVTMIDSNLSTTPAEEIPHDEPASRTLEPWKGATVVPPGQPAPLVDATGTVRTKETTVRFGKSKGKFLCDIDDADLAWQLEAARKSAEMNDPKWGAANTAWHKTVEAEVARRIMGGA